MLPALTLWLTLVGAQPQPAASATTPEAAELKKRARTEFDAATALFAQHRYADALAHFDQAWSLRPHPSLQFNIGKCHELLGHTPEALRAYREYLRLAPKANDREAVFTAISALERKLRDQGLQQLDVTVDQPGATVTVDDADLGRAPVTVALPVGVHRLRVVADGFEPYEKAVLLELVQFVDLAVSLQPRAPAPPVVIAETDAPKVSPLPVAEPRIVPAPSAPVVVPAAPGPALQPRARVWTWVLGGVAVAGAAAGGGLLGASWSSAKELKASGANRSRDTANSLYVSTQTTGLWSTVAFATAGAAAVAAVILFFLEQ